MRETDTTAYVPITYTEVITVSLDRYPTLTATNTFVITVVPCLINTFTSDTTIADLEYTILDDDAVIFDIPSFT